MGSDAPLTLFVWRDLAPRPGWAQMALDHALLDRARADGTAVLRLYRWAGHTVSFGANELVAASWDRAAFAAAGVPTVRRPTGGRAVWHDADDLTYAITAPLALFGGLRPAYRAIHERLAAAVETFGVAAELAPQADRHPGLDAGACFDMAVGGEVLVRGRKTIGSAQLAAGGALLQHGAIALADRSAALARLARQATGRPHAEPPSGHAEPVADAAALADAIAREWLSGDAEPIGDELTASAELTSVQHAIRYRDPDWTWRR